MKNYDLNKIIPEIGRKSSRNDEGHIYEVLRYSPAPIIISGGQSGIDTVGLAAGSFLGLPTFAIVPQGGRREDGEKIDEIARKHTIVLRKFELASESYRFRTWANVYFSDVTLIYDFVGISEGSQATIDACEFFKRPYLVLTATDEASAQIAKRFLEDHSPKVINVAGNSLSKINLAIAKEAYNHLVSCLKNFCFVRKNPFGVKLHAQGRLDKPIIAIPNFTISKKIFQDFIKKEYGLEIFFTKALTYNLKFFTLVTVRPREIINMVNLGIDAGFVGADLCEEQNFTGNIIFDTGLIPNATVVISKKMQTNANDRICSQYPNIAKKHLNNTNVFPISGSAEGYLSLNLFDSCIDTYQTGLTADENGLQFVKKIMETSLVMIGRPSIIESDFYSRFLHYLL